MDVLALLQKIGLTIEECAYFAGGYVFQPVFHRAKQTLIIPLKIKQSLPFSLWMRTKECFEKETGAKVELSSKVNSTKKLIPILV